jgi:hypothetical protein
MWIGGWYSFSEVVTIPYFSPQNLSVHLHGTAVALACGWDVNWEQMPVSAKDATTPYREDMRDLVKRIQTGLINGGALKAKEEQNAILVSNIFPPGNGLVFGDINAPYYTAWGAGLRRIPFIIQQRLIPQGDGLSSNLKLGTGWNYSRRGKLTSDGYHGAEERIVGYYKKIGHQVLENELELRKIDLQLAYSDLGVDLDDYFYTDTDGADTFYHRYVSSQPLMLVMAQREMANYSRATAFDSRVAVPMGTVAGRAYKPILLGTASKSTTKEGATINMLFDDSKFTIKEFASRVEAGEDDTPPMSLHF